MTGLHTIEITEKNFDKTIEENKIVLLDFWASWCGPCKMFGPIFERTAEKHPGIAFGKVDTEAEQGLAAAFGIRSIPTLAIFREGVLLYMQPGMVPEEALEDLIGQVGKLDMDEIRKQIAEHEKDHQHHHHHDGHCNGCH